MRQEELLADVVLNPHMEHNPLSFKASAALIQSGEKTAREAIYSIRSKIEALTSA